jgi:hypothetical protein
MLSKYGNDYYAKIGQDGGTAPKTKPSGFAYMKEHGQTEKHLAASRLGGSISKPNRRKNQDGVE